jgi:pimeloyl-ACP methyl ester carboxylesterase
MTRFPLIACIAGFPTFVLSAADVYQNTVPAEPPYFRVRYEKSEKTGELAYPVSYTLWVPEGVRELRGVVVHQHGCGEGSCKSGQTGAHDLHWQALARKHRCALLSPAFEQPEKADCQLWCDPRNGSSQAFLKALSDLGRASGHPELERVPWALWGHSGGGHWAGGMVLLHPQRVAAAWLRSGAPAVAGSPQKSVVYEVRPESLQVPVMCNLGTREGVTVKDGRFGGVWGGVEAFFKAFRSKGALIGVSADPLTSHECGNQRYLAIPWMDACLSLRLPETVGGPLRTVPGSGAWVVPLKGWETGAAAPQPAAGYAGAVEESLWLPTAGVAKAWSQYMKDTAVPDSTPPPAPTGLKVEGNVLTWNAEADLESGLAGFMIERDGVLLAKLPEQPKNPFGRPIFQNLSYSDTPTQPLVPMRYVDAAAVSGKTHQYRVISVNTAGLQSR